MRQLNATGYMHNRLRMITASFLTKDLGVSWQRGEAYFALHLNDFELASNNGGWQWAASTGCDAQPWFRIFNPVTQSERFDPQGAFIRRWVPELRLLGGKAIHAPWKAKPAELAAAKVALGRTIRARSSTTTWRGRRRWRGSDRGAAAARSWRTEATPRSRQATGCHMRQPETMIDFDRIRSVAGFHRCERLLRLAKLGKRFDVTAGEVDAPCPVGDRAATSKSSRSLSAVTVGAMA